MSDLDPLGGLPQSPESGDAESPSREVRAAETRRGPPAPTTVALLALLGLMFLVEVWLGGGLDPDPVALFRLGSLSAAAVRDGDWWRLGSYAFLHAGPLHLLFNAYALWILMRPIESLFGPAAALGLFAATAIAGGGASMAAATLRHNPWQQAVGASGWIFGLFGAHVALYWRLRHRLAPEARRAAARTLIFNLLINLALALGAQAMEGAAIARAANPHGRTLRVQGAEARVPWHLVPGPRGNARSADGVHVVLGRVQRGNEGGHEVTLGGRNWSKIVTANPADNPTVVLTAADGSAYLAVEAWCYDADCTDAKRDALAEQVATEARGSR